MKLHYRFKDGEPTLRSVQAICQAPIPFNTLKMKPDRASGEETEWGYIFHAGPHQQRTCQLLDKVGESGALVLVRRGVGKYDHPPGVLLTSPLVLRYKPRFY